MSLFSSFVCPCRLVRLVVLFCCLFFGSFVCSVSGQVIYLFVFYFILWFFPLLVCQCYVHASDLYFNRRRFFFSNLTNSTYFYEHTLLPYGVFSALLRYGLMCTSAPHICFFATVNVPGERDVNVKFYVPPPPLLPPPHLHPALLYAPLRTRVSARSRYRYTLHPWWILKTRTTFLSSSPRKP